MRKLSLMIQYILIVILIGCLFFVDLTRLKKIVNTIRNTSITYLKNKIKKRK